MSGRFAGSKLIQEIFFSFFLIKERHKKKNTYTNQASVTMLQIKFTLQEAEETPGRQRRVRANSQDEFREKSLVELLKSFCKNGRFLSVTLNSKWVDIAGLVGTMFGCVLIHSLHSREYWGQLVGLSVNLNEETYHPVKHRGWMIKNSWAFFLLGIISVSFTGSTVFSASSFTIQCFAVLCRY